MPGYLHLDVKLQVRFKSRWDEIRRAVSEQEREYEAEGMRSYDTKKKDRSFVTVGTVEHEQAAPNVEGQETAIGQARSTTVHDEQAQDGTIKRAEGPRQLEHTETAPAAVSPHQSQQRQQRQQQQQQPTDDQSSFDLSEFVGFEEPPLDDDDDNWDDDDTVRVANTTADTFTPLAHVEVPAQNNEGEGEVAGQEEQEGQEGQEDYTNPHLFLEGEGVSAEYGEYEEGEWVAEEGHEQGEGAPVEQTEVQAAGQAEGQGQTGTIEAGAFSHHALEREKIEWFAGDEVAQYDGEEYIGPEYEYIYNEGEAVEDEVGEWTGGSFSFLSRWFSSRLIICFLTDAEQAQLNAMTGPEPTAVVDYSQDASTQQDHVPEQMTQESAATTTTISLHHLPAPPLPLPLGPEPPEAETQEPEEYYDADDGNAQQYYGNYGEGDAEDGAGSLEHPIDLTAVDGGDNQPTDEQQAHGDPNAYTGDQDVDEVSTLEGSPSQDDQPALSEAEAGAELVNDEGGPVLVNVRAGVTIQRRASGYKRRHEDVEAEENEDFGTDLVLVRCFSS